MDAPQGCDEDTYVSLIKQQKANLQAAESRKGQRPEITQSREMTIMEFMFQYMMDSTRPIRNPVRTSFVPSAYTPSVASLDTLKRCMFKDLRLETHHRGTYMVLRAVTPPRSLTGVLLVVEDEEGDVVQLALYNQEVELTSDGRLVQSTVIVVKEPYLKVVADGNYAIRVDHLSDITFVPGYHPIVPLAWRAKVMDTEVPVNDWKVAGNNNFNQGKYYLALDCYSQALNSFPSIAEILIIRQNRAVCFLKTHQFDAALHDLDGLPEPKPSEKALFRKAQALYYLQKFQESCETHKALALAYPESAAAKVEFKRARERLVEQTKGQYQFKPMQAEARKRSPPALDHATYIGPVAVRHTGSRGRGLFTTMPVQAGDLLLCEKAFAYVFSDIANPDQHRSILINMETREMTKGADVDLISLAVQKLQKNPSTAPAVTALYHGSYNPVTVSEVDGKPVVDTFLVVRILSLNSFACPRTSREHYIHALRHSPNVEHVKKSPSGGIWPMASYINHSCYANARNASIGDMMVIRATQDIPANTEITIWYRVADYESVPNNMRHWGFDCTCTLCQDYRETKESDILARNSHVADMRKALSRQVPNLAKAESIISAAEKTYRQPAFEVPRLELWEMCLALASSYAVHSNPRKSVKFVFKTLESLSFVITGGQIPHAPGTRLRVEKWGMMQGRVIRCWILLAKAYRKVAPDLVSQAERYARLSYKMWLGEDETFDQTCDIYSDRLDGLLDSAR